MRRRPSPVRRRRRLSWSTSLYTPVRLLFVTHSLPPHGRPLSNVGGMQRVASELHEALGEAPELQVQSLLLRSSWRWTHVRTIPFMARALWTIRRMARRREIDAVLFSSTVTASLAVALQSTFRKNGVLTAAIVHGRDVTLPFEPFQRFVPHIFDALDLVLPVSSATGAACLERGLSVDKMHVVPNGVGIDRFATLNSRNVERARLMRAFGGEPLPDDALLLCSVGRQVRRKGFAWFLEGVMPLLPENVHYWLAGDGPESARILAVARERGLAHRVRLLGRVSEDDLQTLYRGADLFVMPNVPVEGDMEGFGVVMLEAGLCGLPTIAARIDGIVDVIAEGRNGHLVESGDAWGFSEAVMQYHNAPDRLTAAGRRAANYVAGTFTWQAVASQYLDVLYARTKATPAGTPALTASV